VADNSGHGLFLIAGDLFIEESFIGRNSKDGVNLNGGVLCCISFCTFKLNSSGSCSSDASCSISFENCDECLPIGESSAAITPL
jgi:hypothetical protein